MAGQSKKPVKRNKKCTCGATTAKQHIQAVMMGAGMHPYTGPEQ